MQKRRTIGFRIKQINNGYEKEFNRQLKNIGITASQCEVLDYLLSGSKEEVTQRDIEKALNLRNPTVTGLLKRLDEKGFILSVPSARTSGARISIPRRRPMISRDGWRWTERSWTRCDLTWGLPRKGDQTLERLLDKVLYNITEP